MVRELLPDALGNGSASSSQQSLGSGSDASSFASRGEVGVGLGLSGEVVAERREELLLPPTTARVSTTPSPKRDVAALKKGAKRTASGVVKADGERSAVQVAELSSALKTRLSYAMVKVQHGWERSTISELESLPTTTSTTPSTPSPYIANPPSTTPRPTSAYPADRIFLSPASPPQPFPQFSPHQNPSWLNAAQKLSAITASSPDPGARDYSGGRAPPGSYHPQPLPSGPRSRRAHSTYARQPPRLPGASDPPRRGHAQRPSYDSAMGRFSGSAPQYEPGYSGGYGYGAGAGSPRTPGRPLRMPSQQAEKDAVDTLLFMSSPGNSANMKFAGAGPSPLRGEGNWGR
ncbi:hypothetical protein EJ06DRAFT_555561 [Trichodelitschia bisporula]|uniref:Uncharacterized protein n=1 Tax=Trichodelitschia bisporula TaxID=703511 RepID=A0A6G1I1F2_9PEZI|nr:hypothetical protein EJ06DRAFT_555561 [Trichodelitschia bisporula]